ncbi:MAG: circadian clock protein KaiB [Proteobacteria bacterium]|nr:circadian clock protein KaiB [Burkholderiales bacterium]
MLKLRLYIAGDAPNSLRALANLKALCRDSLASVHELEIVDVLRDPQRALADGVFLTPTLVKFAPAPERRIVGSLSDLPPVLDALGLTGA